MLALVVAVLMVLLLLSPLVLALGMLSTQGEFLFDALLPAELGLVALAAVSAEDLVTAPVSS